MVRMTDEKDKQIMDLKLEIRKLQIILRLQKDIIDSYKEIAELSNAKLVVE